MERKNLIFKSSAALLGAILVFVVLANSQLLSPGDIQNTGNYQNVSFVSNGDTVTSIEAEVASTPEERQKGLMNRSELEENHGMLFIFPDERERAFWMKNTYITLDIIFINENKEIVNIEKADPEPDTPDHDLTRYRSGEPVMYVIEVNQGFSENNSINEGDKIVIE